MAPIHAVDADPIIMGVESRSWHASGLLRDTGVNKEVHRELWLELCAALEQVVQSPRYEEIAATGDGVPAPID